ncbi:FadR/GntR family transcriptional regulator [Fuscibacter oryzae]|uniref:FadR/GntR family transcriptional regulator n=1 Tax=Fuscibacter oryzae TaxID=2803939 RepID=UPI00192CA39F|nr:FCD domain-containing protein [Fuscibacter oryzae]
MTFTPTTGSVSRILEELRTQFDASESEILADGRLLPERELMEVLGVGRSTLRQALEILEGEGLIVRRQGHGTFLRQAAPTTPAITADLSVRTSPAEILEVRAGLEPILARLAAMRATPMMIRRMQQFNQNGADAKSGRDFEKWDGLLHYEIVRASNNELYLAFFEQLNAVRMEQGWARLKDSTFSPEVHARLVSEHSRIVDAIAQRDADRAADAMAQHIRGVTSVFGL